MINVRIVTGTLYEEGRGIVIGGVETYIQNLSCFLQDEGYNVTIYQYSNEQFEKRINGIPLIGTGVKRMKSTRKGSQALVKYITEHADCENDILFFATEGLIVKNKFKHSLAIQHGIDWDVIKNYPVSAFKNAMAVITSLKKNLKVYSRVSSCANVVCVDYNFVNWYRAHIKSINNKIYVIPNFADIIPYEEKTSRDKLSVVFARRFVEYRGTKLFAEAINEIMQKYPNIDVTFAGEGPDENWLREYFKDNKKVIFTKFSPDKSLEFHKQFDIAVIPTIGSEGTSLSLLEAMSAGCAVIASNVGGMTNIVLSEFNGLMISPEKRQLIEALELLICNEPLRKQLAKNAHNTVEAAFSKEKWKKRWKRVFDDITDGMER